MGFKGSKNHFKKKWILKKAKETVEKIRKAHVTYCNLVGGKLPGDIDVQTEKALERSVCDVKVVSLGS